MVKREYTEEQLHKIMTIPYVSSIMLSKELNIPASTIRNFRRAHNIRTKLKIRDDM